MPSIIIVYASMTGNTEEMAEAVAEGVRNAGVEPAVMEVFDAKPEELADYDGILLGAYTWGDGELPDEFLDYYHGLSGIELAGHKYAIFGSADSSYAQFGAAVDILDSKLAELGAERITAGIKVEYNPTEAEKLQLRELGANMARQLQTSQQR